MKPKINNKLIFFFNLRECDQEQLLHESQIIYLWYSVKETFKYTHTHTCIKVNTQSKQNSFISLPQRPYNKYSDVKSFLNNLPASTYL